jgi:hypothetical protein
MQPLFWSGKLELEPGSKFCVVEPIYPRLWEYIDKDLRYLGYDAKFKTAMLKWGKLTEAQFTFALDTNLLPWLEVGLIEGDDADFRVIGDTIVIPEDPVNDFEKGHGWSTPTRTGKVQYLGVVILVGLVVWGNNQKGIFKLGYREIDAFCQAVFGYTFDFLRCLSQPQKKAIPLIKK